VNRIQIASHRGCFGGNIVENTLEAFETALKCGADILETDLRKTKDREIVLFHDTTTDRLLHIPGTTQDYTLEELRRCSLYNVIGEKSGKHISTLDEFLLRMKDRCLINLDQCWEFADEAYTKLLKTGMENQALIKGRVPYSSVIQWLRKHHFQPKFIPILTCDDDIEVFNALPSEMQIPIVEIFLTNEDADVISPAFLKTLEDRNIGLWINALDLSDSMDLCAGHNDTVSVSNSPDEGWGWLIDHGATVIQTDWPGELKHYLKHRGSARQ
jgi:glycerophosphoryl diester phosphodiesterase